MLLLLCGLALATASSDTAKLDFLARFPDYGFGAGRGSERRIDQLWQKVGAVNSTAAGAGAARLASEWRNAALC